MHNKISSDNMLELISNKLSHNFGVDTKTASYEQYYRAIAMIVNEILIEKRSNFIHNIQVQDKKHVYYICMEFLMGRSLKNNLFNLGIEQLVSDALKKIGIELENIYDIEPDAALGNGGLGRLAACFLDALSSNDYSEIGYCLKYEYGIFKQKLVDGWQTELPEFWLHGGDVWLNKYPEKAVEVLFDGEIEENWDGPYHQVNIKNATKIIAVPSDMLIPGFNSNGVNKLRLWEAVSTDFDMDLFNSGEYIHAMERNAMAKAITNVLYPEDNHPEGKSLRLSQQYFLVSATIQDIVRRHLNIYKTLDNLPNKVAIHLNDTHPVLAIPELLRLMLDECGYSWEKAYEIMTKTISYTNHTVMSEALECWNVELIKRRLPRIFQIIEEINRRFCEKLHADGIDTEKISQMSIINDGIVKMANLAVICSNSVNGVSELHSNILKEKTFNNFYNIYPHKIKNITNGISYRRWLNQSNPRLSSFITGLIGDSYISDADNLSKLLEFKDDTNVLLEMGKIKLQNKIRLSNYIKRNCGITVDPNSIFDVQAKRLHEYKRQHLNALNILSTYLSLKENPNQNFIPKTYIFAGKAASGYYFAKEIIKFIFALGKMINKDPDMKNKLKVIFIEDYKVSLAELIIPAAEISEQISLAGKEASGTGNMKFMLNGAVTLGTLDGANIEIKNVVGDENIVIFGMTANEVSRLKKHGYDPYIYYINNAVIKKSIDTLREGFENAKFDNIVNSLLTSDPYMVLADFADYNLAQQKLSSLYSDKITFNRMALCNIANSGIFSADRTVREYANKIWGITPVD